MSERKKWSEKKEVEIQAISSFTIFHIFGAQSRDMQHNHLIIKKAHQIESKQESQKNGLAKTNKVIYLKYYGQFVRYSFRLNIFLARLHFLFAFVVFKRNCVRLCADFYPEMRMVTANRRIFNYAILFITLVKTRARMFLIQFLICFDQLFPSLSFPFSTHKRFFLIFNLIVRHTFYTLFFLSLSFCRSQMFVFWKSAQEKLVFVGVSAFGCDKASLKSYFERSS